MHEPLITPCLRAIPAGTFGTGDSCGGNGTAACGMKLSASGQSVVTGAPSNLVNCPGFSNNNDFVLGTSTPSNALPGGPHGARPASGLAKAASSWLTHRSGAMCQTQAGRRAVGLLHPKRACL